MRAHAKEGPGALTCIHVVSAYEDGTEILEKTEKGFLADRQQRHGNRTAAAKKKKERT